MVKAGDKITVYTVFTETFVFLEKERIMIVNNNKATFDYMDKAVKEWKNVNRINKPMYITFYSDWKNKKITKDSYSRKVTVTIDQKMKAWIDDMEVIRD